jgi:FMN phosphatase YigB (HAD superfamily)
VSETTHLHAPIRAVCFDWGGTLMADDGPVDLPMCSWPTVTVLEGARECLATLDGLVPLCLATNASASSRVEIERALDRGGLLPHFSHVFCFSELGCRKHRPEFWGAVHEHLSVPLHQVVMVGDSLEQDVLTPRRLGLQAVWLARDATTSELQVEVPTVADLVRLAELVTEALAPP